MSYINLLVDEGCKKLWDIQDGMVKECKEDEYILSAFSTAFVHNVQLPSGENREYVFPNFTHISKLAIVPEDRKKAVSISFYHARRIRNYLAAVLQHRSPVVWRIRGKDMAMYNSLGDDDDALYYPHQLEPIWQKSSKEVAGWLEARYELANKLLSKIKPETLWDICINLYGSALWSEDVIDAYICRWKVTELIAKCEFEEINRSTPRVIVDYRKEHKNKGEKLGIKDRIILTMNKLYPEVDVDAQDLVEETNLRDDIAHGDITIETYENEFKHSTHIMMRAKLLLQTELKKELKDTTDWIL